MILRQKKAETYVDTAITMLISVVIGALLLFGLKSLMENIVLPKVTERISNLFSYADSGDDDDKGGGSTIVTPTTEETIEKGLALPEGAQYTCSDGTVYDSGMPVPTSYVPKPGDVFAYNGYTYNYVAYTNPDDEGWNVVTIDKTRISYEKILSSVCGADVKFAILTFSGCTNMTKAPTIPSSVVSIVAAFKDCTSLKGWVEINASIPSTGDTYTNAAFSGTEQNIAIYGTCNKEILTAIAEASDNIYMAQLGDMSIDGSIDSKDQTYLRRMLKGMDGYVTPPLCVADINGDGEITEEDVTTLQHYLAKWEDAINAFNASKEKYWGTGN